MVKKTDLAGRLTYLITEEGSRNKVEKKYGISVRTQGRILTGEYEPSSPIRRKLNRAFTNNAPAPVRARDRSGRGAGFALVNEKKAKSIERSYRQAGKEVAVVAHQNYHESMGGSVPNKNIQYAKGSSVEDAKQNVKEGLERKRLNYNSWLIVEVGEPMFRVYPVRQ